MNEKIQIDIEKLVSKNLVKGVVGSSLSLENRKLGDENISKLSNMEELSEVISIDLGENNISDDGLMIFCDSPFIKNLKTLNLKSNDIEVIYIIKSKPDENIKIEQFKILLDDICFKTEVINELLSIHEIQSCN